MSSSTVSAPAATATPAASASRRHGIGFWVSAAAFATVMAFSAVPTPLYGLYAQRDGFGALTITVVFAVYAVGVILALFTVGHLSDWHGRQRVMLPAIGLALVSAAVFLLWRDLPGLLVARLVNGVAVGATTATATAWLGELHGARRPQASSRRAELVSVAANVGGIGTGPLISGALAQWVTRPLTVPYLVFVALLLVSAGAVALTPETRQVDPQDRPGYRPQQVRAPAHARAAYFAALGAAFVAFSAFALFTSLAPAFLSGSLHHPSLALAGAAAFLVFGSAAVTQLFLDGRDPRTLALGAAAMIAGSVLVVVAVWLDSPSLGLFLAGGTVLGIGAGADFKGAIATVLAVSDPRHRAEALSGLFLSGYLGLVIPAVGLGVLSQVVAARVALMVFGAVLVTGVALSAPVLLRRR